MILPVWSVPLFSINIPIAFKSQSWVGPYCAKCFMDTCLKQLRKRGKGTVVWKKSVIGLWMESRPILWSNTMCMDTIAGHHCVFLPSPAPISIDHLVPLCKMGKNRTKSLFILSFQKVGEVNTAWSYLISASWSNFGGVAMGSHVPCFVESWQENTTWRIQKRRQRESFFRMNRTLDSDFVSCLQHVLV